MPGPEQTTLPPSPIDQLTHSGVATAVALTDPTVAVTVKGCHVAGLIHSQVARFTTDARGGLN